ncbi:uncharacterized protein LOC133883874 [Phragmites australis]|uniref:uncharacterized protein LOC133883874 n=1 Tax=Phragmites australis TaxID=29695 RepID=UPI002D79437B|nr:uncharacterized protein LOC133883874 [Phragmites australis]
MAAAPSGGSGEEEEVGVDWQHVEICQYKSLVFECPRGLYRSPVPVPEADSRRRRVLLRLREKYLRELARWEALASQHIVPRPAPLPPPPQDSSAAPHPAAAATTSAFALDDLLTQVELQEQLLKKVTELCDELDALCNAGESDMVDAITVLPVWGDPRGLMKSLCSDE